MASVGDVHWSRYVGGASAYLTDKRSPASPSQNYADPFRTGFLRRSGEASLLVMVGALEHPDPVRTYLTGSNLASHLAQLWGRLQLRAAAPVYPVCRGGGGLRLSVLHCAAEKLWSAHFSGDFKPGLWA